VFALFQIFADVYLDTSTDQPTMPNCRSMVNGGSRA
jgi:hypothetical protein